MCLYTTPLVSCVLEYAHDPDKALTYQLLQYFSCPTEKHQKYENLVLQVFVHSLCGYDQYDQLDHSQ